MRKWAVGLTLCGAMSLAVSSAPVRAQAAAFDAGQAVEVREGDVWSKVTIVKKEGRRYQIRYDDGTEEWVTADRLRAVGAAGAAGGAAGNATNTATPPKPATQPAAPAAPAFKPKQAVEVKWGGMWFKSEIVRKQGEWYLIEYKESTGGREWVEPWRIREAGSKDDVPYARPNPRVQKNEGPPSPKPGAMPEEGRRGRGGAAGGDAASAGSDDPLFRKTDLAGVREAVVEVKANAAPKLPAVTTPSLPPKGRIAVRGPESAAELAGVLPAPGGAVVYLGYIAKAHGGEVANAATHLERIDFSTGRPTGVWELSTGMVPTAVSVDGNVLVLTRPLTNAFSKPENVEIWSIEQNGSNKPVKKHLLIPFDGEQWPRREIKRVLLSPDGKRLLVTNGENRGVVYDTSTGAPAWQFDAGTFGVVGVDPAGRCVVAGSKGGVALLDFADGSTLGQVKLENQFTSDVQLMPDGKRLVVRFGGAIRTVDLASGDQSEAVWLGDGASSVTPVSGSLVLVNGSLLLDVDRRAIVHQFDGKDLAGRAVLPSGQCVAAAAVGKGAVTAFDLVTPAVQQAAAGIDPASQTVLKPGDAVALSFNLNGPDAQKCQDNARKQIEAAGLKVADGAPVKLVYESKPGETRELEFRTMGRGFGTEKVSVTEQLNSVRLEVDGKAVWTNGGRFTGEGFVQTQGKTIAEALEAQKAASVAGLGSIPLPRYLLRPVAQLKAPTSKLTADGVKGQ